MQYFLRSVNSQRYIVMGRQCVQCTQSLMCVIILVELVNVEAVVQCIRNTSSPQIQQQALIVMTAIAPLYPVCITQLLSK